MNLSGGSIKNLIKAVTAAPTTATTVMTNALSGVKWAYFQGFQKLVLNYVFFFFYFVFFGMSSTSCYQFAFLINAKRDECYVTSVRDNINTDNRRWYLSTQTVLRIIWSFHHINSWCHSVCNKNCKSGFWQSACFTHTNFLSLALSLFTLSRFTLRAAVAS